MARLEQKMSAPDFWQDQQGAQKMLQRGSGWRATSAS
jgi:hypothetical protein